MTKYSGGAARPALSRRRGKRKPAGWHRQRAIWAVGHINRLETALTAVQTALAGALNDEQRAALTVAADALSVELRGWEAKRRDSLERAWRAEREEGRR